MNSGRLVLILLSMMAIGFLVLPSTVSLFAGQHNWYNLSGTGNDLDCEKCHADVADEMEQIHGPHTNETGYGEFECSYCHRAFPINDMNSTRYEKYNYTFASGDGSGASPGKESHAASTVPCMYCHSGGTKVTTWSHGNSETYDRGYKYSIIHTNKPNCLNCHPDPSGRDYAHDGPPYFDSNEDCYKCHRYKASKHVYYVPPAGGFGLTASSNDTGSAAAHRDFVYKANETGRMEDVNEACIACHTNIPISINWTHRVSMGFNATLVKLDSSEESHYKIANNTWKIKGNATARVWGNTTGAGSVNWSQPSNWPGANPGNYTNGYS